MTPALLKYYNQELEHLREMGAEFAAAFPKIAGRLGLERFECADPYVERLLEGFSFLAARVQMKLDAQFPRFTEHLTEIVYPHYLAPTPSMAIVQFEPDFTHPSLAGGVRVPRHTALTSQLDRLGTTRCEYRTAHAFTLWPLALVAARYTAYSGSLGGVSHTFARRPGAALHLRFEVRGKQSAGELGVDRLPIHLRGSENWPLRLFEQLTGHVIGAVAVPLGESAARHTVLPADSIAPLGFSDDEALLPVSGRSLSGYRLLDEYFAFPERFLFVELRHLRAALEGCGERSFELVLLFDVHDPTLEATVNASHFALYATPAINLFPRRADRITVDDEQFEYHVVVDRTRPIDFEVHSVQTVDGYRTGDAEPRRFEPLYRARERSLADGIGGAYFQLRRQQRQRSEYERKHGARSRYLGSEVFIALVDANDAPFADDLRQLGLSLLCTNRDLPLMMPLGAGVTDFTFGAELPAQSVRCIAGPSEPRPCLAQGDAGWRLLNHLSINYLSLAGDERAGPENAIRNADALRELLALYCAPDAYAAQRRVAALRSVGARPVTRRLPLPGPIAFGRGLEVTVEFDDTCIERANAFLMGAVLRAFFASYVSINHFTETVVRTATYGDIMRWPPRAGSCAIV